MVRRAFFLFAFLAPLGTLAYAVIFPPILWGFLVLGPVIALGCWDVTQKRSSLRRYKALSVLGF